LKDKRTFFQYYFSLLKKKQLILFIFCPMEDFNLLTIKISLFLINISLSFTINGFFFSDEIMHKIYIDKGASNIMYRIAEIIYSSIICVIIKTILDLFSLSEKNILKIKHQNDLKNAINITEKIEKCIKIKFIVYFILSNLFLIFFWYFISCFCVIYNNCQILLILDFLFSLGLSMVYPFALNLIPGIFRIYALRAAKNNRKCLYKFSLILAII